MVIAVATVENDVVRLCAQLRELGGHSIEVLSPTDTRRVVLAALDDEWSAERCAVMLRAEGEMAVTRPDRGPQLKKWSEDTLPIAFADRLSVSFAWSEHDRGDLPGLIELGPGGFGSGHHPTTRLVVDELAKRIRGDEHVLDVGCGSGILGLCALRIGADRVVAVDIKAGAIKAAQRNAEVNGMCARLHATLAPLAEVKGTFDVVVANVAREGIIELASELISHLSPGGWLAVSGISPSQCSQVAEFLRPLVEVERRTSGEWSVLVVANSR